MTTIAKRSFPVLLMKAPEAAGIAVRAADTGRVLMIQRSNDPDDPAAGAWEFPGGILQADETAFDGARREWQEEVGTALPHGDAVGQWRSGVYRGFVHEIPRESDIAINLDRPSRRVLNPDDPDGDQIETAAWWDPAHLRRMGALRPELRASRPWARVAKDDPSESDVHVDAPLTISRKRKRRNDDEIPVAVLKADEEQRIVYGVVLEPDVEDSQGDVVSKEDVELAAHRYLYQQGLAIGDQHRALAPDGVRPVESYIAPCDFELAGEPVKKGSWVLVGHIPDERLWKQILAGEKTAWSVAGKGLRTPVAKAAPVPVDDWRQHLPDVLAGLLGAFSGRVAKEEQTMAAPVVNVTVPPQLAPVVNVTLPEQPAAQVHCHHEITVPAQPAPVVHVAAPEVHVEAPAAPVVHVTPEVKVELPTPGAIRIERDGLGRGRRLVPDGR